MRPRERYGHVAEWFKAIDLKSIVVEATVGSNPTVFVNSYEVVVLCEQKQKNVITTG